MTSRSSEVTLYEESNGDVKFDLGLKVKVKSTIVRLEIPVATYMGEIVYQFSSNGQVQQIGVQHMKLHQF